MNTSTELPASVKAIESAQGVGVDDDGFAPVEISLAYRLGELTLFSWPLQGLANRRHFAGQVEVESLDFLPIGSRADEFYFFPSYPVTRQPPRFEMKSGWIYYTPYVFRNYYVDLRRLGTFENYLAGFSAKSRSTLKRKVKKFSEANGGEIDWRSLTRKDQMDEFLGWALPLSAKTYQERLLGAGLPTSDAFAAELRAAAAAGEVHASLLFLSGKAVAYVLCFCRNGIATYDFVGYDAEVQALSPGTVLQYLIMEELFKEGRVRIFDFTEGEGAQKLLFSTDNRLCAKTYVLRATRRNRALLRLHYLADLVSARAGRLLDQMGLKTRLKKYLRK